MNLAHVIGGVVGLAAGIATQAVRQDRPEGEGHGGAYAALRIGSTAVGGAMLLGHGAFGATHGPLVRDAGIGVIAGSIVGGWLGSMLLGD